jgi:iron complex outermembrane receptor protein
MPFSDAPSVAQEPAIVVVGTREDAQAPNTKEEVDAARLEETTNLRNAEDSLRYLPSLLVRKRHLGDTQAPLATRTSGVGASARSLIYADGVLLSALIGNNNSFASPKWGMVSPEEISTVDVLYGPFSAAYPGNSLGAVVNIVTRMPQELEATATAAVNVQSFDQYATSGSYPAYQLAGTIGDKAGPLSWFASANHVDSRSQPLAYVTVARPASTSANGTIVTGAFRDLNRTGQPILVLGAGRFEHQLQDNFKLKLGLELAPSLRLAWTSGLFLNDTASKAESYLAGGTGPAFAGPLNIDGRFVTVPASAFSNQVYRFDERHSMHSLVVEQSGAPVAWSLVGSLYHYGKSVQRLPSTALPGATVGGSGSITRMDGTGWRTLDFKAASSIAGAHQISGGAHFDGFTLRNRRFSTDHWLAGSENRLVQSARGRTRTWALWLQDRLIVAPAVTITLGGRYEWWKAYGGANFSLSPALDVVPPVRTAHGFSPKASIRWEPGPAWSATLSAGRALRFPTVSELYQAISTGPTITVPNPGLRPEDAIAMELALQKTGKNGRFRISVFHETVDNALLSQAAPLVAGSTALFNFVQNIGRTRTNGIEIVAERRDLVPGIDLSGSVTFTDPRIMKDRLLRAAEGKTIPQVPRRKATIVATWRPADAVAVTLAGRYASKSYGTIDNSDPVGHTYQGFEGYFVADARLSYELSPHWRFAAGVENLTGERYFLFHPFPGRTFTGELAWRL